MGQRHVGIGGAGIQRPPGDFGRSRRVHHAEALSLLVGRGNLSHARPSDGRWIPLRGQHNQLWELRWDPEILL